MNPEYVKLRDRRTKIVECFASQLEDMTDDELFDLADLIGERLVMPSLFTKEQLEETTGIVLSEAMFKQFCLDVNEPDSLDALLIAEFRTWHKSCS